MILSGMLLRNVGGGIVIRGLKPSWSKQIRAAALAIIFLRSGLEIDLDVRPALLLFLDHDGTILYRTILQPPSVMSRFCPPIWGVRHGRDHLLPMVLF